MFAAMAALKRRKTTLNPTTSGICLMMGSLLTRAAESNVRQGVAAVTKKRGTEAPRPCCFTAPQPPAMARQPLPVALPIGAGAPRGNPCARPGGFLPNDLGQVENGCAMVPPPRKKVSHATHSMADRSPVVMARKSNSSGG
jgi:hypothetical protein